jgi:hypothetical protein
MSILLLNILELFTSVRQYNDSGGNLLPQFMQLLVSLFDLLIESLVLNFQLLKIDEMETVCQLLFLFQNLLLVGKTISQGNILQAELVHFLIFLKFCLLLHLDVAGRNFLACP